MQIHPISKERAEFIANRIRVLSEMYKELLNKPAKYTIDSNDIRRNALVSIQAEKLQLSVEYEVLTVYLKSREENES